MGVNPLYSILVLYGKVNSRRQTGQGRNREKRTGKAVRVTQQNDAWGEAIKRDSNFARKKKKIKTCICIQNKRGLVRLKHERNDVACVGGGDLSYGVSLSLSLSLSLFVWLCSYFEIDLALALAGLEVSHYYSLQKNYNNLVTLACGKGPWSLSLFLLSLSWDFLRDRPLKSSENVLFA